jgi:hypothetical protein
MREMVEETISGVSPQDIADPRLQPHVTLEEFWIPVRVGVEAEPRRPETILSPSYGPISPQGENWMVALQLGCRQEKSQITRGQESRYGRALHFLTINNDLLHSHVFLRTRIASDRTSTGKGKEFAPLRKWSESVGVALKFLCAGLTGHVESGMVVNSASPIGENHSGRERFVWQRHCPVMSLAGGTDGNSMPTSVVEAPVVGVVSNSDLVLIGLEKLFLVSSIEVPNEELEQVVSRSKVGSIPFENPGDL